MNDIRFGSKVRAVRVRLGWRQSDVALRAGVSQSAVCRLERGQLDHGTVRTLRRILAALEIDLDLTPRWRGGDLDRLADEDHAALVGLVAGVLEAAGWEVRAEVSFSVYGERGSIDLLAWHAATRILLVVEVKSTLTSVEETLRRRDVKVRLATRIATERFAWDPRQVAPLLVLPEKMAERRRVARHAAILDRAYPLRGRAARSWITQPSAPAVGALLFLSNMRGRTGRGGLGPRRRIRRPNPQPSTLRDAPSEYPRTQEANVGSSSHRVHR